MNKPGDIIRVWWAGNDRGPVRARLVRHYEHPAGNGWLVNIYNPHGGRFSKIEQAISDEAIAQATPDKPIDRSAYKTGVPGSTGYGPF